ncbi:sensor histidine kinase [Polymorphobacter glacialis]|uniref:Sensor histidine kinase n=1 Tax=Sandarakinorhabdus glacialis TaxID=1614636 RepID=A0A917E3Z2_9SPHN|nr:histidine kinase dimerization/phosphoacceptor domain -containing protein [Polymorphobacter glacialis]GGE00710.1 sensor histidine kinase [Polymorphobacter glacialis]
MADVSIIPSDEARRLAAVRRYDILDTPPDGAFDRITALAARRFGVPISIISIVDEDRIWFKSHHGVTVEQIGRDPGLCASAILSNDPHILIDASIDPRSLANPLVAGDFGLRFYAGVPLMTNDGHNLGTLCIIDREARPIDQSQIDDLKDLAAIVMDRIELQLAARRAVSKAELMAKEIDHRVMNSLQFVSSLLAMQSRSLEDEDAVAHLQLAANRVAAVAQVHRHFYAEGTDQTSCLTFLRRLCADLASVLDREIQVSGDEGDIPTTSIQPIGLLVNELATNAAKHGQGLIEVRYEIGTDRHTLIVSDEGRDLPTDFDPAEVRQGLGMRIVTSLANQLGGELTRGHRQDGGSSFKVSFPAAR